MGSLCRRVGRILKHVKELYNEAILIACNCRGNATLAQYVRNQLPYHWKKDITNSTGLLQDYCNYASCSDCFFKGDYFDTYGCPFTRRLPSEWESFLLLAMEREKE